MIRFIICFNARCCTERDIAKASRLFARPSVTLRYRGHIHVGWNALKIILRLISLGLRSLQTSTSRIHSEGNIPSFSRNRSGLLQNMAFGVQKHTSVKRLKIERKLLLTACIKSRMICRFSGMLATGRHLPDHTVLPATRHK